MIHKMAATLSCALANRGIFNSEDAEVYAYGFELMISTILNIVLVIIISFLFSAPLAWLFFLLAFIPSRTTAGGYHAKTHLKCCITFCVAYTIFMLIPIFLSEFMTPLTLVIISVASLITVLLLAPMPASSKPMSEEQRIINRRRSIVIAVAGLLLTAVSFVAGPFLLRLIVYFALGQAGAAISLIADKILNFMRPERNKTRSIPE